MYYDPHIADGVAFLGISDDRFKTDRLSVRFSLPMTADTVSARALLPFLLTRCSADYPSQEAMSLHLDTLYGADLSGDTARTAANQTLILSVTSLSDRCALDGDRVSEEAVRLLLGCLFRPALENGVFRAEDMEQERRCLIEYIASEFNSKRAYARRRCEALLFPNSPCGISEYGTVEGAAALTAEEVTAALREVAETADITWIYVGGGDPGRIAGQVRTAFADRPRRPCALCRDLPPMGEGVTRLTEEDDLKQAKLFMGFRFVEGAPSQEVSLLLSAVLGGGAQSLLFETVREKLGLCYYCAAGSDRLTGSMTVDSGVDPENLDRAEKEILRCIDRVAADDFTEEQWQAARLSLIQRLRAVTDTQVTQTGWYLNRLYEGTLEDPDTVAERLAAVDRAAVAAAAKGLKLACVYTLRPKEGASHE